MRVEKAKQILLEEKIYEALKSILIFPGKIEQFEELVGYGCFIIDNGLRNKGLYLMTASDDGSSPIVHPPFYQYSLAIRKKLVDDGIVGLIHAKPVSRSVFPEADKAYYGLPVGKKNKP